MKPFVNIFMHWLPLAVAIVGVSAIIYGTVQQNYRQSLNDPQIQLVEDAQAALIAGKQPAEVIDRGNGELFDAGISMKPFLAIYDESGNILESNATVDGKTPTPPAGVFEYARSHKENRVTWQPDSNTRIALVVRPVAIESGWFVASGRNMRDVEEREGKLTTQVAIGVAVTLVATFFFEIIGDTYRRRSMKV